MKILLSVGARPNFMKIAPLLNRLGCHPELFQTKLIHTGQHYGVDMSDVFFTELDLPRPDRFLGVGSGSHAEQTARIMVEFEKVCIEERPNLVIVVGDVNSTMACAITAKKLCVPVAHVEAGLRSRDWKMPEEINRVVTDVISDLLFTPSRDADENLISEGVTRDRIHFVGNIMIDCLLRQLSKTDERALKRLGLEAGSYAMLTMHRPGNVDEPKVLSSILDALVEVARKLPIVWPIHPRTRKRLEEFQFLGTVTQAGVLVMPPVGYIEMLSLTRWSRMIITDSGGLQQEATILSVPCITLRENTEWPVTVAVGGNCLVGSAPEKIFAAVNSALNRNGSQISVPELWDGKAAGRIAQVLASL
jgi:UDP-N-acetylglucosamine 2-epimerase (non-hydrolysing)